MDEKVTTRYEVCANCDGTGEVVVGCAMTKPVKWDCHKCGGSGYVPVFESEPSAPALSATGGRGDEER